MKNRLRHIVRTTNWWMNGLLVVVVVLIVVGVKLYVPERDRAIAILEEARQQEAGGMVYADTVALAAAIDIFHAPIPKLLGSPYLSEAYYHLGRYYDLCAMQYEKAAQYYIEGDYYLAESFPFGADLYQHMGALCGLAGKEEAAIYYKEKAEEAVAEGAETMADSTLNTLTMREMPPHHEVDLAVAGRLLSDHRETQRVWRIGRFSVGTITGVVLILLVFFYLFYQTFSDRLQTQAEQLQTQAEQLQAKEGALQDMAQSVHATRRQELTHHMEAFCAKYPEPSKAWHDYGVLKQATNPALLFLPDLLEKEYHLTEREVTFCILHLLYPERTMPELAEYMHYAPSAIRSYKQRIAKKVGVSSAELADRLREIAITQGEK